MDLKDTYNKIAKDWFRGHQDDTWWIEGTNTFISLLKKDSIVLDVGCGAGIKSKYLLDKGLRVVGIDFSEKMIELAQREVPAATYRVADIRDLSNLNGLFDGILAQAVLLHIPKANIPVALVDLRGKLKDGGYLYIAVKEKKPDQDEEEMVIEKDYGYPYERFFSYFTLPEIKKHVDDVKMRLCYEDVTRSGHTNWIQVIAKK